MQHSPSFHCNTLRRRFTKRCSANNYEVEIYENGLSERMRHCWFWNEPKCAVNRLLDRYPDLQAMERDILRIHSNFVSRHDVDRDDALRCDEQRIESESEVVIADKDNEESVDSDNENNIWCHCRRPSNGNMIRCDNECCAIKWFHWKCCRIYKAPRDKWFCKQCRRYAGKSNVPQKSII